jgi:hypothetical protein
MVAGRFLVRARTGSSSAKIRVFTISAVGKKTNSSSYKFTLTPTVATTTGNDKQLTVTNARDSNSFIYPSIVSLANLKFNLIVSYMDMTQYGATINFDTSRTSLYEVSGTKVSSWTDYIGNYQFIQTTDSLRPTITTQNGITAFSFGSVSSNYFQRTTPITISVGTYIIVYNNTSTNTYSSPLHSSTEQYLSHGGGGNTLYYGESFASGNAYSWVNKVQIGTPSSGIDSISRTFVNNMCVVSQTFSTVQTSNLIAIGTNLFDALGRYIKGKMCEIIIFPTKLSDANRITIETHLMNKWGVV